MLLYIKSVLKRFELSFASYVGHGRPTGNGPKKNLTTHLAVPFIRNIALAANYELLY